LSPNNAHPRRENAMTKTEFKRNFASVKALFSEEEDVLKKILREVIQEVLEQEMTDSLGAAKGERSLNRLGYRSGYYERSLITRVGKHDGKIQKS
jgi:putative transposase